MIKTLLFSTLFPSSARPIHGIFVETRLRELLKSGQVETRVVAPVPWFPFSGERFGEYGRFGATPQFEKHNGVDVHHPRYVLPPSIGMRIAPFSLALGALPTLKRIIQEGFDFDLIDAHYYYPDGVAASLLAKWLGKPFVVTARGTDLNLIPQYAFPRKLILKTAAEAYASIGVCKALMDTLGDLGADRGKLHVFRNGVDLERFKPEDKTAARKRLGLTAKRILLSVGHLVERKGHHIAIEALTRLQQDVHLVIAGSGPEETNLRNLTSGLGLADRVLFAGQLPNPDLKWWYSAADVLVLCSSREGWANVLLEAMACGTPVVATNIWGTPEVVNTREAGSLMEDRSARSVAESLSKLFTDYPRQELVRQHAEKYSWADTSAQQIALFSCIQKKPGETNA